MSHTVQWSPAPARDHNECLARFKPCHEIRASSPSATPITTASPAAAPALVKESRPGPSPQPLLPVSSASSPKISPFRSSPPSHHLPTANVPPFCQDFSSKGPAVVNKALPFIPESSSETPLKSVPHFFQEYPKTPSPHKAPSFLGDSPKTPPRDSPKTPPTKNSPPHSKDPRKAPAVLPFFQEASSSSSSSRQGSTSPKPGTTTPPKKTPSPPYQEISNPVTTTVHSCGPPWLTRCAVAPRILEEEDPEEACERGEEGSSVESYPHPLSSSSSSGNSSLCSGTTGRSQSKSGYSRMWEDPLGDRHAIPLYNRLHFSTVPRKTVAKKTWYLVHNTYASLQNSNGHHPHHHNPHHATHTFTNGARMEEVGGDEFRSHNHAERLMRKMETCVSKRQLCDVVLIAGPRRLPAHRLVLSAASDYFAAMFMNNVREATMEEVELKDVDPEALASLVQYTYTGRIELKEETVECLLSTACLLQLSEVVEACCSFLMKQLHPSNCIGIRQFADAQGCTDLYKVANNYVMEMFVEVMHNSEFLMLPCEEVCKLLASDDLNVPNEETIFEALVKWAKHDLTTRRKNLSKLLAHIKLPLMAPQYIADHVETNSLFRDDRECQQLIMEALKYHLLPERRSSFQSPRTKPRKSTVGVLYAVGGMDCTKGATSIEKYELRTNTWTQVANMSGRRLQFGVAVLEDRLYVVGGRDGLKTLNTVECYDPKKKTWTLMPPMSTHRHGLGVGVLEGPMYAVGGHDGWSYLNTVERWDPQARQWSYVAPMSTARSTVGVASLHGKLYAVGGRDGSSCLKSVECFDPHTNKWTHCTPMAKRRGGVGVATCNGFLYAVGGHEAPATNPTCSRYDSAERYDPKTDQWTNISPISSPRDAVGLCPLGDKLLAVGGYDGQQYLNDVECYDPITNEWVKVASLCTGRAGACVVHVPNS